MPLSESYQPHPLLPELGDEFYDSVEAADFPQCVLRYKNLSAAQSVGLETLTSEEWKHYFWSFSPLPGNLSKPLALRYHGHQFTHYNPDLGDGRGFVHAQLRELSSSRNLDLGTKGSGTTPWSRRGDGRLTLKGAVREALATSFLEALGVNTSKTFCFFETGEALDRNDEPSPTRSAVLTRLSHSHIRIGTFQRLAYFQKSKDILKLAEYALRHYYPDLKTTASPTEDLFKATCHSTALTTARWMLAGFVHGVLNTDNINITGESFDYGPYRFLPHYDAKFTAAYFDHTSLYAYGRQPSVMMWNLQRLAEALGLPAEIAKQGFEIFQQSFTKETFDYFLKRLNILSPSLSHTEELFSQTIHFLDTSKVPFQAFFFDWFGGATRSSYALNNARKDFYKGASFEAFFETLKKTSTRNPDLLKNSYFSGLQPATLLIDEIEALWARISEQEDWSLFERKIKQFENLRDFLKKHFE